MNSYERWEDLVHLTSFKIPASYLKLHTLIWNIQVQSIAEIGVFKGIGSKNLRIAFPEAFLYLIDPWELYDAYRSEEASPVSQNGIEYEEAYVHVQEFFKQDPKVKILRKSSMDALNDVPDGLDLVFIDGNHEYSHVKQDIENWFPKVRPGGIISGHDYAPDYPGVIQAVDEAFPEALVGYHKTWIWQKQP